MEIAEAPKGDRPYIERYGPGSFRISGETHEGSVLIFQDRTSPWSVSEFNDLEGATLADSMAGAGIEILVLGCGRSGALVPAGIREAVREAGAVIEAMDTGAACRTYNLLAGEGRAVGAALIALPV